MFQVKTFDPKSVKCMESIIIIGKRYMGKTVLINDLLLYMECSNIQIINPTEKYKAQYDDIVPHEQIHEYYSESIVDTFVANQQLSQKIGCVVFDNCMYDNKWSKHISMKLLYTNRKNLRAKVIMAFPYATRLPIEMKLGIDYVFIFKDTCHTNRKKIYEQYGLIFPTFEIFCQILDEITQEPFNCMVIDCTQRSLKFEDSVMCYKANLWKHMVKKKKEWLDVIREELMQMTCHPKRIMQCLSYDELGEIFGIIG